MTATTLVWLRRDLRLDDNPALHAAAARGAVVPVFIWAPREEGEWLPGAASRVWLHQSLAALAQALEQAGSRLVLRTGAGSEESLGALCETLGADAVYWNRLYEPESIRRDTAIKSRLRDQGIEARSFNGALLNEPTAIENRQGKPFRVFTPFYKHCAALGTPAATLPAPTFTAPDEWPASEPIEALGLLPRHGWDAGIRASWTPGEAGAHRELESFTDAAVDDYASARDLPAVNGVSRLSPHLHFGEVSPRQVWHAVHERGGGGAEPYLRQLYWRDFAHHLLFHFPHTTNAPMQQKFETFPWQWGGDVLDAWQRGRTGYPLVDAGMRELWQTGWMHNRVRMNVASFLVKHLLTHWLEGARWFWDTLVDADLANNTMGWQWTAGCGADAAPYFRIFNPVAQGERFDPRGDYVRRWVPELARMPAAHIHAPWSAPAGILAEAGVRLGHGYPLPVIDHREARARALAALEQTRS